MVYVFLPTYNNYGKCYCLSDLFSANFNHRTRRSILLQAKIDPNNLTEQKV